MLRVSVKREHPAPTQVVETQSLLGYQLLGYGPRQATHGRFEPAHSRQNFIMQIPLNRVQYG
jgi:hypothetical protein